jgi:hypothetical protein
MVNIKKVSFEVGGFPTRLDRSGSSSNSTQCDKIVVLPTKMDFPPISVLAAAKNQKLMPIQKHKFSQFPWHQYSKLRQHKH